MTATHTSTQGVFGLRMRIARLRLGDEYLELTEFLAPRGRPRPPMRAATTAGSSTSRSSSATWIARTSGCAKSRSSTPRPGRSACPTGTRTPAASGHSTSAIPTAIRSRSSRSRTDKGNPKWQRSTDALFLGIDHTAIVISDTKQA